MGGLDTQRGTASSHYDLLARLAAGGMAEIFLARANSLQGFERYVVLKRIRQEHGGDPKWVQMFLDEARLAGKLQHPNIAQVFDLGMIGDDYFFTMEFVHGKDVLELLEKHLDIERPIPTGVILNVIAGAAAGLAHAHDRVGPDGKTLGIVHRDVSPSNLMVSYEGTVKVLDFGIAKMRTRSTETQAGVIMGKLAYLSPEQCRTGVVDHRSDIFSLGVVFYEMLTRQRAFKREGDFETLRAVVNDMLPPPSSLVPNLPVGIDQIVMTALAKRPGDRYDRISDMIDAIEELAETEGLSLTPGVLRRHMKEMWGTRPEPWRTLEQEQASGQHLDGLPIDVSADEVPLLQATGLIDVSMLVNHADLFVPTPHRMLLEDEDIPTPLRIPTGSVPEFAMDRALASLEQSAMYEPAVIVRPSLEMPVAIPPPAASTAMVAVPSRKRSPVIRVVVACLVVGIGLGVYFAVFSGSKRDDVHTRPAMSVTPIEAETKPSEAAGAVAPAIEQPQPEPAQDKRAAKPKPAPIEKPKPAPVVEVKKSAAPVVEVKKPTKPADKVEPKVVEKPAKPVETKPAKPARPECPDPLDCQY